MQSLIVPFFSKSSSLSKTAVFQLARGAITAAIKHSLMTKILDISS